MAYGCGGSSPPFRTILKGSNDAKLLFPLLFYLPENLRAAISVCFQSQSEYVSFWKRILIGSCLKSVHTSLL